jgi:glycosyltransferase involved in cell wall biosynthesis
MKTSVLIVAHNEEAHIKNCIESVLKQTVTPDEIVVICHNCTDDTVSIARSFDKVKVIEYYGPEGVPYARIKGFEEVSGDIIACLDGDGTASPTWLQNLTAPLIEDPSISIVAGYVILTNDLFARLTSFWQFVLFKKIFNVRINTFAWGSNFACRKNDYQKVGGIEPIIALRKTLPLHFWAEDFYISLALMQIGKIYFALNAKSYTQMPYWKINLKTAPLKEWREDNKALLGYFEKNK